MSQAGRLFFIECLVALILWAAKVAAWSVYVTHETTGEVSVVSPVTNQLTGVVTGVGKPVYPAADFVRGLLYVTDLDGNSIKVIDTQTLRVAGEIPNLPRPNAIAVHPNGKGFVTNRTNPGIVSVVDLATRQVETTVDVGVFPYSMAIDNAGLVYVVNTFDFSEHNPCHINPTSCLLTVSVIDPTQNSRIRDITIGGALLDLVLSPDGQVLYVTAAIREASGVAVVNVASGEVVTHFPYPGVKLALGSDGKGLFVLTSGGLTPINLVTGEAEDPIPLGDVAGSMAVSPDGRFAYVPSRVSKTLTVIDLDSASVVDAVRLDAAGVGVVVGPQAGEPSTPSPSPTTGNPLAPCAGDCTNDRYVTVDELATGIRIILGAGDVSECIEMDENEDNQVTVDELVSAVVAALEGCDV